MHKCRHFFVAVVLFSAAACFSLYSEGVTSPSISTIQAPTLGSGFYMPNSSTNPAYRGSSSIYKGVSSSEASGVSSSSEDDENELSLFDSSDETKDFLSTLTASDISLLSKKGLLDQLGSLLGTESSSLTNADSISNLYSVKTVNGSSDKLTNLIKQMEELKREQAEAELASVTSSNVPVTETSVTAVLKKTPSRLLRFSVNGYDVLRTCRTVYISDVQNDGTFLVTGDRRYMSDGKARSETFHMLFTVSDQKTNGWGYNATTAVTQDEFNQYSFLYELSQRADIGATRTGNFVTMRTDDPDWRLELLIDLGD